MAFIIPFVNSSLKVTQYTYLWRECRCGKAFKVLEEDNESWHRMKCEDCKNEN